MLLICTLVKLPKFGNCQVQVKVNEEPCLTSLSDLTPAFQKSAPIESHLDEQKLELDGLVEEPECENVFTDTSLSGNLTDCIIYYVLAFFAERY